MIGSWSVKEFLSQSVAMMCFN